MLNLIVLIAAFFSWNCIWLVPASLTGKRRKNKKPIYGHLLFLAMGLELALTFGFMLGTVAISLDSVGFVFAPVLGAVAGGYFYWIKTGRKDILLGNAQFDRTS
jgi:hypothetical protein